MQDIYFRGRQPIPELVRIGLMTDHLAETLRLHPPENLRGDVYLYVATPQGTRDVARLLPEVGEEHTLYLEMKVDLDTITAKDGYVPLLGTGANGATGEAPVTINGATPRLSSWAG